MQPNPRYLGVELGMGEVWEWHFFTPRQRRSDNLVCPNYSLQLMYVTKEVGYNSVVLLCVI
jgi:hypothetical protein